MFEAVRNKINVALGQKLGVDVQTAQQIIAAHGEDALLNTSWSLGGTAEFVTPETLPSKVKANIASGATRLNITVFKQESVKLPSGTTYTFAERVGKYPIKLRKVEKKWKSRKSPSG